MKRLRNIAVVFWIYVLESRSALGYFLLSAVALPGGMLLFTAGVSEGKLSLRLLSGSMVFALSILTVMGLGYTMLEDRFRGRLKFIVTSPVRPSAYLLGIFLFALFQGLVSASLLVVFGEVVGLRPILAFELIAISVFGTMPMAAIALFNVRHAHSIHQGSLMNDIIGTGMVMICPVFYPAEVLPAPMRLLSRFLPPTYTADALLKVMAGGTSALSDLAVLALMSAIVIIWGLRLLPWRAE